MTPSRFVRRLLLALCLSAAAASVFTQTQEPQKPFTPYSGQPGKDVVWVPTPQATVDTMLNMAKVTAQDFLMDLGSGDGRTVITAAKRGARAMGIEYNPDMVELSKRNAVEAGVTDRATFMKADLFDTDFSKATVISMFLLPSINMKLRPKILDLKPGTRIVSNTFDMEDWTPDETIHVTEDCESWCTALLWIVPAKVDGTWRLPQGDLTIAQSFQMLAGTLGGTSISGKLRGDEITFTAGSAQYIGHVNGNTMEGTLTGGNGGSWKATRVAK